MDNGIEWMLKAKKIEARGEQRLPVFAIISNETARK